MARVTLNEISRQIPVVATSNAATTDIERYAIMFKDIIAGISGLVKEYKGLQGILTPNKSSEVQTQHYLPTSAVRETKQLTGGNKVNSEQFKKFGIAFLTVLENQGFGDRKIGEVLLELPFSVSQVKGFVENPLSFIELLMAAKNENKSES